MRSIPVVSNGSVGRGNERRERGFMNAPELKGNEGAAADADIHEDEGMDICCDSSRCRSARRALKSQELTVPTGVPSRREISR